MEIQQPHQLDPYPLSRRVAPFGYETQVKLMRMRIFLHGVTGLGIEIAKKLSLMSLKEITIFDNTIVTMKDVGRNFACRENHIGKMTRAEVSQGYLKELNPNCKVKVIQNDNIDFISNNFDCVVVVDNYSKDYLQQLNKKCRENNVGFILAGCLGLYGYTFVDFGRIHTVYDKTGEQFNKLCIKNITQSQHGVVQFHHQLDNLKDDDVVEFGEVQGMTELNRRQSKVKIIDKSNFQIGDTRKFTAYKKGGYARKVNIPLELQFMSLQESFKNKSKLNENSMTINSSGHMDYPSQLHFILNGMYDFFEKYNRLPQGLDEKEYFKVLVLITNKRREFRKYYQFKTKWIDGIDQQLVRKVSMYADTQISPMCSFWGGIAAQQVVKITGKYTPIHQWMHHQFFDALPQDQNIPRTLLTENNRYNDYITLFGDDFFNKLKQLNLLLVGAGSVGGECLKMMTLMGVGTGENGKITVVDDKKVMRRHLNSHFLLKNQDVGSYKTHCVTQAIKQINSSINVAFSTLSLQKENQDFFNQDFWQGQDLVIGAIGNLMTRWNLDNQCLQNQKPMIQGRIRGTQGKSLIVIPHKTQSVMDVYDNSIEERLVHILLSYPIEEETTKDKADYRFQMRYQIPSQSLYLMYTQPKKFYDTYDKHRSLWLHRINNELRKLKSFYQINESKSFQSCVQLMIEYFHEQFVKGMDRLVTLVQRQYEQKMQPIKTWKQRQRRPQILELCLQDPLHLQLIQAGANIYAQIMNIPVVQRAEEFLQIAHSAIKKSQLNSIKSCHKVQQERLTDEQELLLRKQLLNDLMQLPVSPQNTPKVIKLDLENPNKWHTQFIKAAYQLRSLKYGIKSFKPDDYFRVTYLMDDFQPKIVTTAAVVAGLMGMEMIKYQLGKSVHQHKKISVNLALSQLKLTPINPSFVHKDLQFSIVVPGEFTQWTKINIKQPMLLCQLIQYLEQTYNIKVTQILYEDKTVYNFNEKFNSKRRLVMRVEDAVQEVIKKKICRMKRTLCIELTGEKDGIDCILPNIRYHFTGKPQRQKPIDFSLL